MFKFENQNENGHIDIFKTDDEGVFIQHCIEHMFGQ